MKGPSSKLVIALIAVFVSFPGGASGATPLPSGAKIERATEAFLREHGAVVPAKRRAAAGAEATLPESRVVALYGAPQMGATILGLKSPKAAAAKLAAQSRPYSQADPDRPVVGAFDLVSVFATAGGGADNLFRTRQDPDIIEIYLEQARAAGARLILDVQPGRSTFLKELKVLKPWLVQPDVDLALDPEWNVGRRGIPGQTAGKVKAKEVNAVARRLARIVRSNDLPPKLMLVHQFRQGSIRSRRKIERVAGVETVLNFDGIGAPAPKASGYAALSVPGLFDGFSLFYQRDTPLMKPAAVLALEPAPDFLLYQ